MPLTEIKKKITSYIFPSQTWHMLQNGSPKMYLGKKKLQHKENQKKFIYE